MKVQGAALSIAGRNFVVVLVKPELLDGGEGDMAIETLQGGFGEVPVVLLAQGEDGAPRYYGAEDLVTLLRGVPLEKMPFREYEVS